MSDRTETDIKQAEHSSSNKDEGLGNAGKTAKETVKKSRCGNKSAGKSDAKKSVNADKINKAGTDKTNNADKISKTEKIVGSKKSRKPKKIKVLFVCTGNTCRSPMAEQLFKDFLRHRKMLSFFEVKSAGLYAEAGARMNDFASKALVGLGVKTAAHEAQQLTEVMAEGTDFLVCMTAGHKKQIEGHGFIFSLGELTGGSDVPDPYGGDLARYEAVARYLQYACEDIFKKAETLIKTDA